MRHAPREALETTPEEFAFQNDGDDIIEGTRAIRICHDQRHSKGHTAAELVALLKDFEDCPG